MVYSSAGSFLSLLIKVIIIISVQSARYTNEPNGTQLNDIEPIWMATLQQNTKHLHNNELSPCTIFATNNNKLRNMSPEHNGTKWENCSVLLDFCPHSQLPGQT